MFSQPLKCAPSVTKSSLLLHTIGFLWYCNGIYHDRCCFLLSAYETYGGRFKYLTQLTAYIVWIAFGFAFVTDLTQLSTNILKSKNHNKGPRSILLSIRDELMSFWVFTLSVFVCILYWSIIYVDFEGMHTEEMEKIAPLFGWFNQYLHTVPLFIAFVLTLCVNYQHPPLWRIVAFVVVLGSGYMWWITHCAKINGSYPYGFMNKQTTTEFVIFVIFCHFVFFGIYLIGRKVALVRWNEQKRKTYLISKHE